MTTPNDEALSPPADLVAPPATAAPPASICANCGAELLGQVCYACGQPVKGMVRHLSSILADVADTILNIDSRIFRTLKPLLFKPGYLTNEYLAGRRVRYVTPFRLYFFLSVVAFLVMQVSLDATLDLTRDAIRIGASDNAFESAPTIEEVESQRDAALAGLEQAKIAGATGPALKSIERAADRIRERADRRLHYLHSAADAKAQGKPSPPDPALDPAKAKDTENFNFEIGGKRWDPKTTPIQIGWLPGFVNAKLNLLATRMIDNLPRIKKDPKPFLLGAFGMLPQVLFLVMPLFAMLLKIFYIFKRRLYMEHLIVALHSHSFIFLSLLLLTLAGLLRGWANGAVPFLGGVLSLLMFILGWWLPIYLLIMQKRVYRQGWFFTVVKFLCVGFCYTILVTLGLVFAFLISLATTSA